MSSYWHFKKTDKIYEVTDNVPFNEATLLKLNCDKAMFYFKWKSTLDYVDTIRFSGEWYYDFYNKNINIFDKTTEQIYEYEIIAKQKGLKWTE